jgi:hypothetical protein
MSQETPIGNLQHNSMNMDDSRLVDSILNDLNKGNSEQEEPPQVSQVSQDERRAMLEHRQNEMMQQQMMQQQMMMQQQQQLQNDDNKLAILDKLQSEWKSILVVIILSITMNMDFINGVFKMNENTYFIQENGSLNMSATIVKGVIVGSLYFLLKTLIPI